MASIAHVSDTALMTAACRAIETKRPDGLIRDSFAEQLAGERGMAILRELPGFEMLCIGVGVRSRLLDQVIITAIRMRGVSTILSIGAGLDARPYRLHLSPGLLWIEVDLPAILDYKADILSSCKPTCRIERVAADINDPVQRSAIFERASIGPVMMLTEGLLMYLPGGTIRAFARDAARQSSVGFWLMDVATRELERATRENAYQEVEAVRAPDRLDGDAILAVLDVAGWIPLDRRIYAVHGSRLIPPRRLVSVALANAQAVANGAPPPSNDLSGVHLFGRP